MDPEKKKELEVELSKLTILQLRDLARRNSIDISGSIRKKELIDKILASDAAGNKEALLAAPPRESKHEEERAEEPRPAQEPEKIEQWTAPAAPQEAGTAADQKILEVREYIRFAMTNRPSFFTIDSELEAAVQKYMSGDHYGAIKEVRKARQKASDVYSIFRIYTNALGIDSSEKVLEEAMRRGRMTPEEKKALTETAMIGFVDGTPARREETLDALEAKAMAAFDSIIGDIGLDIEAGQKRASDLQDIGANVLESINLLKEADRLRLMLQLDPAKQLISRANDLMKQAEKNRVEEIRFNIPRVRASIEDAKVLGLDVTVPEKDLEKASYHFERGEMKLCVDSLSSAGFAVDQNVTKRLATDTALKQGLLDKAKATMQQIGGPMNEAHSFGIDASEGFHYMSNTQIAIGRQDPVNAIKFAKKAEEIAMRYADELKMLKEKSTHVDAARCWQCGQDMLYDYPNGVRRCSNCGASMKR